MLRPSIFRSDLMDTMFDDFFRTPFWSNGQAPAAGTMSTDIKDTADGYQIEMNLPGFAREDVTASLKDGYLTVCAENSRENEEKDDGERFIRRERYQGMCKRSFYVGEQVTEEDIKAKFRDGVLILTVPKKEKQPEVEQKKYISIEG